MILEVILIFSLLSILLAEASNEVAEISSTLIKEKILSQWKSILIILLGILLGFCLKIGGISETVKDIFIIKPDLTLLSITYALTALFIFLNTFLGAPISSVQTYILLTSGITLGKFRIINFYTFYKIIFTWFVSPLVSLVISLLLSKFLLKKILKKANLKYFLCFLSFLLACILGSNDYTTFASLIIENIGIVSIILLITVTLFIGLKFFSSRIVSTVTRELLFLDIHLAVITQLSTIITVILMNSINIPISITQAYLFSIVGSGIGKNYKLVKYNLLVKIILAWIITGFSIFSLGFVIGSLLLKYL